jgi:hypothetical protein
MLRFDVFSRIDEPPTCPLQWDESAIERRQWYCAQCRHNVTNLSAMTRREVKKLLSAPSQKRRCVSFLLDEDGRAIFKKSVSSWVRLRSVGAALYSALIAVLALRPCSAMAGLARQSPYPAAAASPTPVPAAPGSDSGRQDSKAIAAQNSSPSPSPSPSPAKKKPKVWTGW